MEAEKPERPKTATWACEVYPAAQKQRTATSHRGLRLFFLALADQRDHLIGNSWGSAWRVSKPWRHPVSALRKQARRVLLWRHLGPSPIWICLRPLNTDCHPWVVQILSLSLETSAFMYVVVETILRL